jgi:hypothetical protein
MNRVSITLACAALLFAVQPALAGDDVSSELAEMRAQMQGLQQKVEAQEEQLEHQGQLLEQAQTAVKTQQGDGSESGLSPFLDYINVGGHVAASYNYNFNTLKDGEGGADLNAGAIGEDSVGFMPWHRDANQFSLTQAWFSLNKEGTKESPAFFGFDIVYGETASFLGQGISSEDSRRSDSNDETSDLYVHQAYVGYFCDCLGPEMKFQFGKWTTLVGAEVAQQPANFNITRGNVYTFLQPVDHMGLLGTVDLGMAEVSAAVMNSSSSIDSAPDNNKELSYLGSVKVGDEKMNLRASYLYGNEIDGDSAVPGDNHERAGLVDVTAWFNPTDNLSMWVNYNHLYIEGSAYYVNGVANAVRLAVTDKIGVSVRGEYIREHMASTTGGGSLNSRGVTPLIDAGLSGGNQELYSLTGTVDYALTDHLMARAEARFDAIIDPGDSGDGFFENHHESDNFGTADNQTVGLVEVIYTF